MQMSNMSGVDVRSFGNKVFIFILQQQKKKKIKNNYKMKRDG